MFARTRLLIEGVKKAMRKWEKAHARLHRVTRKGFKEHEKKISRWERRRPDEAPEDHARRLQHQAGDVDQSLYDKVFAKHQSRIEQAAAKEARRREKLARAEEKKRRKQLMKAPIPSLDEPAMPVQTRTAAAVQKIAPHVVKTAQRPRKMFPVRRRA